MRITGGEARGRRLAGPKGEGIRPTSDKVREAVFNLIGQDLHGTRVLDLFAGTGAMGAEALSRGARAAVFVDISPHAASLIARNLQLCGFRSKGVILRRDLTRGLPAGHPAIRAGAEVVFLDPPYGKGLIPPMLLELGRAGFLAPGGLVVAESSRTEETPRAADSLVAVETRLYGDTKIRIYQTAAERGNHE